jgi:hypothetical protein
VAVGELLARTKEFSLATDGLLERESFPGNGFVSVTIELR